MKKLGMGGLAFLAFCLIAGSLHARLVETFQQQDAVILTVKSGEGTMLADDYVTYKLANKEVLAKASELEGQRVHILYFARGEDKYCGDLRPFAEPAFDLEKLQAREKGEKKKGEK
jgi:hypothetical protein